MAIKEIGGISREEMLVQAHGETCSFSDAGRILGVGRSTAKRMCDDGRLDAACGGERVDVRSIARYIISPAERNEEARIRRAKLRRGSSYAV